MGNFKFLLARLIIWVVFINLSNLEIYRKRTCFIRYHTYSLWLCFLLFRDEVLRRQRDWCSLQDYVICEVLLRSHILWRGEIVARHPWKVCPWTTAKSTQKITRDNIAKCLERIFIGLFEIFIRTQLLIVQETITESFVHNVLFVIRL